ncbi:MAG TPA: hypothetical protein VF715_04900 [Thermoleophilaceae bacterium]|jgi:hypothetical protein
MAYGNDVTVFVEDKAGDLGAPNSPAPWWLSPDVDIPAHPGEAVQGPNDVRIRVHAHEEPMLADKIVAEVYVGDPALVLSPTTGTRRIDPGDLRFRTAGVSGTEPVADVAGATLSFQWTPSSTAGAVDGPGHRCLVLRAFPENVTPPSSPFDVPNEQHEAQRNVEILTTTMAPGKRMKGEGTREDPRRRDRATGMWWDGIATLAPGKRGRRYVAVALDPRPDKEVAAILRCGLPKGTRFSTKPPAALELDPGDAKGNPMNPAQLLGKHRFAARSGIGRGLFAEDRLLAALQVDLGPRRRSELVLRFDHTNLDSSAALVLHLAQWNEAGVPEGGITVVALAPLESP